MRNSYRRNSTLTRCAQNITRLLDNICIQERSIENIIVYLITVVVGRVVRRNPELLVVGCRKRNYSCRGRVDPVSGAKTKTGNVGSESRLPQGSHIPSNKFSCMYNNISYTVLNDAVSEKTYLLATFKIVLNIGYFLWNKYILYILITATSIIVDILHLYLQSWTLSGAGSGGLDGRRQNNSRPMDAGKVGFYQYLLF